MVRQGYGKLSNGFHSNTKVKKLRRLCPSALGVYAVAISYCSDVLNDGVMSEDDVIYQLDATEEDIEALLKVGMFERLEDGSYRIHDYLKHQSSREQVETKAEGARNRKRKQRSEAEVTPESREDKTNVTSMSRRDNSNVTPESREDSLTKNQEPITKNLKNSSNEEFSLPQTPSQAEGAGEEDSWREDNLKANLGEEPRAISYEQAKAIVEQVRGFYPASKMRGRSYERTLVLESAPIVKAAGAAPDIVAWFVNRCREYVARQSEPRYVTDFGIYVAGGGKADKRPYWEVDWANEPMPKSPEEEKAEAEHERRLRDVDWLCSHVDDEECQRAALALSEKQQALARSKWPDEWYRLWRRAENLRDREERERMEAGA